jgi:hypothetical protein
MEDVLIMDCALEPPLTRYSKQRGENGHEEYGWSKMTEELMVQLQFQLVREKNPEKLVDLEKIQRQILKQLVSQVEVGEITIYRFQELLTMNYKLVAYTRDIYCGKGEQQLAFLLILVWYDYYPSLAKKMLNCFFEIDHNQDKPFGSWKDMKYFCDYCLSCGLSKEHPLVKHVFELTIERLKKDVSLQKSSSSTPSSNKISLVSKWIPREKSKFSWIFHELSFLYFEHYLETPKDFEATERAITKCNTDFRKLLSFLNKRLETVQIKQCAKEWKDIDFNKVTSKTIHLQSSALFNLNEHGNQRTIYNDRIECANQFKEYVKHTGKKTTTLFAGDYVKKAFELLKKTRNTKQYEMDLLNTQWTSYVSQFSFFGHENENENENENSTKSILLPIVDVSLNDELLCHSIGLACFIANKSVKRIMTFGGFSNWINLEECETFVDKIKKIQESITPSQKQLNSNLYEGVDKLVETMIEQTCEDHILKNTTLVLFSDMQIEDDTNNPTGGIYDVIQEKFTTAKGYKPPHIIFWNVKKTNGFPTTPKQYNVSMLSGYNPIVLKTYFKKTTNEANDTCNSWFLLKKLLGQKRYDFLEEYVQKEIFCV